MHILCYTHAINRCDIFIIILKPTSQYQCFDRGQTYSVYHQYNLYDVLYNSYFSALALNSHSCSPHN